MPLLHPKGMFPACPQLRWPGHPSESVWALPASSPGRSGALERGHALPGLSSLRGALPALDYALGSPYVFMITPPHKSVIIYIKLTQLKSGLDFCLLIGP